MRKFGRLKSSPPPTLKAVPVGDRTLVLYDSVLAVLGIDPANEPDRPKAVSIQRTMHLLSLSKPTIERMIAAGRAETNQDNAA